MIIILTILSLYIIYYSLMKAASAEHDQELEDKLFIEEYLKEE